MPLHRDSAKIASFFSGLLAHDKARYFTGRKALIDLTADDRVPTAGEMIQTLAKQGIAYHSNDSTMLQAESAVFFYRHGIRSTPCLVVENSVSHQNKILTSGLQISEESITAAISDVAASNTPRPSTNP